MNRTALFIDKSPYRQIAEILRREKGWETYGFSAGILPEHRKAVWSRYLDLYSVIDNAKVSPVPGDIIQRCERIEEDYDLNLADIISTDRALGIGWVTGGLYHRGKLSHMAYERHLHIIDEVFRASVRYLDETHPDYVCPGTVGSLHGAIIYAVCGTYQIPVYGLNALNYDWRYYWQRDRFGSIPDLEKVYQRLKSSPATLADSEISDIAPRTRSVITGAAAKGRFLNLIRKLSRDVSQHYKRKAGGVRKTGETFLSEQIRYAVQNYRGFKKEMRRQFESVSDLANSTYLYFPLHFEPEASLNGSEPYFTNQLYAIELLSKSVPVGVDVLVKEHPSGVGNRPSYWMDAVAGMPRVKLAHPFENSIQLVRRSLATATITGTAGLEAAILGKPVLSLGPSYRFNFVDHVWFGNELLALRRHIRTLFENGESTDYRENGARLKRAIDETCFKIEEPMNARSPSKESIERACGQLLKLFDEELSEVAAGTTSGAEPVGF